NGVVQGDAAAVDPGDGQAQRLATDKIGELGLPTMQDIGVRHAGMRDEISKQRAVRVVALGALRGADEIEGSLQRGRREQIVLDIRHDRELIAAPEPIERRQYVVVKREARERIEIVTYQMRIAANPEFRERIGKRRPADLAI